MRIFLDSANISEIKKWVKYDVVDGVTTNPSIMFKDDVYDIEQGAKEIAQLIGDLPLSVEVTTNDLDEMLRQARQFARWAPNIVIKIPIINSNGDPCLEVISTLEKEGIPVNTTAIMSFGQVVLAAKAGSTYVSIFAGRVSDEGHNAAQLIKMSREWLDMWGYESKIIVGSIREVMNIQEAAMAGGHIITVPPKFLGKMIDHKYTRETVKQFVNDAMKSLEEMENSYIKRNRYGVSDYRHVHADVKTADDTNIVKNNVVREIITQKIE